MTSGQAGVLVTVQLFAGGLGGLVGGYVGDFFFKWSRFHGRPLTAQFSVVMGTLVYLAVFLGPSSHGPEAFNTLVLLFALFGLTATWAGVGCNLPILLDLVDPRSRARIAGRPVFPSFFFFLGVGCNLPILLDLVDAREPCN
jgi:hypothetical protein